MPEPRCQRMPMPTTAGPLFAATFATEAANSSIAPISILSPSFGRGCAVPQVACKLQATTAGAPWQGRSRTMRPMTEPKQTTSALEPLRAALERVGDRWSLLVVESLLDGPMRFNDLQAALPGIAPNILSARLRRLESERVLQARPYSERPVRLRYELTAEGRELAGVLRLL